MSQVSGTMIDEICLELNKNYPDRLLIYSQKKNKTEQLLNNSNIQFVDGPTYNRSSNLTRITSWLHYVFKSTIVIFQSKKNDLFLLTTNPPILLIWFYILNFFLKRNYVIYIYDIYPDVLVKERIIKENGISAKIWKFFQKKSFLQASKILVLNNSMFEKIKLDYGLKNEHLHIVSPWVDTKFMRPIAKEVNPLISQYNKGNKKIILYSGNMGYGHEINTIVKAAKILKDYSSIKFLFFGEGKKEKYVRNFLSKNRLTNLDLYPLQPIENLPYTHAMSDICLVGLRGNFSELMIPSKVFSYMASGKPIIAICKRKSELGKVIINYNLGFCVEPGNADMLAEKILSLLGDQDLMAKISVASRLIAKKFYDKQICLKNIKKIFDKIDN